MGLLRVELDDELLAHRDVDVLALGQVADGDLAAASPRSSQPTTERSSMSRLCWTTIIAAAFGDSDTTSPLRTRKLAMSTRLPLTRIEAVVHELAGLRDGSTPSRRGT